MNTSLDDLNLSNQQVFKPAFRHLSSPKLSKIGYNKSKSKSRSQSRSRSRSRSKSSVERAKNDIKLRKVFSNESINSADDQRGIGNFYNQDHSYMSDNFEPRDYTKPILKSNQFKNPNKMFDKLELIRKENDVLRKKYEKLSYFDSKMQPYMSEENRRLRRPYEECYLDKNEPNKTE